MVAYNPNLIDVDAADFFARQIAAGGAGCGASTKFFVNQFVLRLKDAGVWAKIARCNIFVGSDLISAMVPLKVGTGANSIETYNFVSGDYSQATGLQGNGTSKYMRTGLTPANAGMTVNDGHLIAYSNSAIVGSSSFVLLGVKSASSTLFSNMYQIPNSNLLRGRIGTNGGDSQFTVPNTLGFFSVNALSGAMNLSYNGKSLFQTEPSCSGSMPTLEYYVMARNENGTAAAFYHGGRLCFYSIGSGLTKTELGAYRDAVQRLQSNLGRAYYLLSPILCWGDSLTAGSGGTPYPTNFQSAYPTFFVWNGGIGGDTSTQILTRFNADPALREAPTIIWAGRNDVITPGPTTVKANIATMVAALAAVNNNKYLILSVPNKDTEYSGSSDYTTVVGLNSDLASLYGAHYFDIRAHLISLWNQNNATDVTNHTQDIPPSSLRFDTVHFNTAGYKAISDKLIQITGALGWWP